MDKRDAEGSANSGLREIHMHILSPKGAARLQKPAIGLLIFALACIILSFFLRVLINESVILPLTIISAIVAVCIIYLVIKAMADESLPLSRFWKAGGAKAGVIDNRNNPVRAAVSI
jgi:hypothetical protein